ncbi:MAG: quinolinate synthase NadA [Deltaproteobacteria bacterium]|jgi:quinolinate synthase|nr:quinolinate synthase NadA [Deltaproteobacteria bacterium]
MNLTQKKLEKVRKARGLIERLNVSVIAHFYQRAEVKALANFVGGSAGIFNFAERSNASAILICGVSFLPEAIEALRPDLQILSPRNDCHCPLSRQIDNAEFIRFRIFNSRKFVVADLKASALVRALSDLVLTSPQDYDDLMARCSEGSERDIIVAPALSLGDPNGFEELGWPGAVCQVHARVTKEDVLEAKKKAPRAKILVNSLCQRQVRELADFVGDSQSAFDFVKNNPTESYLVIFETGLVESLALSFPHSRFIELDEEIFCPNMKLNNLKDLLRVLEQFELTQGAQSERTIFFERTL